MKYIKAEDLNSNSEFVTKLNLQKDLDYIIKYSHGGRSLNDASLELKILTPDSRDMKLDLSGLENVDISEDIISDEIVNLNDLSQAEIDEILAESGMTLEELEAEIELSKRAAEDTAQDLDLYVKTDVEVMPPENPCIILYKFKAPMTGSYEFKISELSFNESGDIVKVASPDVPFEFRIYGLEAAHSVFDDIILDESIDFTSDDILDIQRILLNSALEFNENGLPVDFEALDDEDDDLDVSIAAANNKAAEEIALKFRTSGYAIKNGKILPIPQLNNVPYDALFQEGAGFHAHTGLRAVTNVMEDLQP